MRGILTIVLGLLAQPTQAKTHLSIESYQNSTLGQKTEYALYLPAESKPRNYGLLIWFHADGAASTYADAARMYGPDLAKLNLATLAIRAPQGRNWHDVPDTNSRIAHDIITRVIPQKLRLNKQRIVLAGASGGAVFITGMLLPKFAHYYAGGAVLLCGGAPSLLKFGVGSTRYFNQSNVAAKKLRLYFKVQKGDYIYTQSRDAATYYQNLGFEVNFEDPSGGSHCGFDLAESLLVGVRRTLKM